MIAKYEHQLPLVYGSYKEFSDSWQSFLVIFSLCIYSSINKQNFFKFCDLYISKINYSAAITRQNTVYYKAVHSLILINEDTLFHNQIQEGKCTISSEGYKHIQSNKKLAHLRVLQQTRTESSLHNFLMLLLQCLSFIRLFGTVASHLSIMWPFIDSTFYCSHALDILKKKQPQKESVLNMVGNILILNLKDCLLQTEIKREF